MKQIEYSDKQKLVLEILDEFTELFYEDYNDYDFKRKDWHDRIESIKKKYGIVDKYLTLRKYLATHSSGAYHRFSFKIDGITVFNVTGITEFERYYNSELLDKYYVVKDEKQSFGSNCENYQCEHYLSLVLKDD